MIKQDWMVIVAGEELVDALTKETTERCRNTGRRFASEDLCVLQRERSARGILGAEVICTASGCSVRYDSGLQDFGLLASERRGELDDDKLETAEAWARKWVARDPARRYAWRRKTAEERA